MSITVKISRTAEDVHENGYSIGVSEGHLYVRDGEGETIAIYAPDHWNAAGRGDTKSN